MFAGRGLQVGARFWDPEYVSRRGSPTWNGPVGAPLSLVPGAEWVHAARAQQRKKVGPRIAERDVAPRGRSHIPSPARPASGPASVAALPGAKLAVSDRRVGPISRNVEPPEVAPLLRDDEATIGGEGEVLVRPDREGAWRDLRRHPGG